MKPQRTPLLLTGMMIGGMKNTVTFREITAIDELERVFRFRYEEYSQSRMDVYLNNNEHHLDMDVFDLHSQHFGLFLNNGELIGCLRVVLDRGECYNSRVFEVGRRFGIYNGSDHSPEQLKTLHVADFPFLSYPYVPEAVKSNYAHLKNNREEFAEASRLIISGNHRGVKLFVFLLECAMVLLIRICNGRKMAMIHCCKDHGLLYERYGFLPFNVDSDYHEFGIEKNLLCLPATVAPKGLASRVYEMVTEFSGTGKIISYYNPGQKI